MLRIRNSVKQTIGGAQDRKRHLRFVDPRSQPLPMPLSTGAQQHRLNPAARTQRLLYKTPSFHTDTSARRRQSTAQSNAKLFQPPVLSAGQKVSLRRASRSSIGNRRFTSLRLCHVARLTKPATPAPFPVATLLSPC